MLVTLRDAINRGKTSNEVVPVVLNYSVGNFDNLLVDHPTLKDVKVLPNTYITKHAFDIEVQNAFIQWEFFFNSLYGEYISLSFKKSNTSSNISISVSEITDIVRIEYTSSIIQLKSGLNWAFSGMPSGKYLVLNYLY